MIEALKSVQQQLRQRAEENQELRRELERVRAEYEHVSPIPILDPNHNSRTHSQVTFIVVPRTTMHSNETKCIVHVARTRTTALRRYPHPTPLTDYGLCGRCTRCGIICVAPLPSQYRLEASESQQRLERERRQADANHRSMLGRQRAEAQTLRLTIAQKDKQLEEQAQEVGLWRGRAEAAQSRYSQASARVSELDDAVRQGQDETQRQR